MSDVIELFTLGGLSIQKNGQALTGFGSRKAEALLVYLACTGRGQAREVLAELLWTERTQSQSLANLRTVLSSLRQQLGPHLAADRQMVGLNPDSNFWLDVAELEAAIRQASAQWAHPDGLSQADIAQLEKALTLYRGDFLQGFSIVDSKDFEDWMLLERDRLRHEVIEALHYLVNCHLKQGTYTAGITQAARLLQLDPLREEAHYQLMMLLARTGQRSAALTQYETCRRLLDEELGVEPSKETTALYEKVRAGELSALALPGDSLPQRTTTESPSPADADGAAISHEQADQQEQDAIARLDAELRSRDHIPAARKRFINSLPQDVRERFKGRTKEQAEIVNLLMGQTRLVTIYGRGGVGKTALACKVLADLENAEGDAKLAGTVYLSGTLRDSTDMGISLDRVFSGFTRLLRGSARDTFESSWRDPQVPTVQKVTLLLNELWDGRYILLLDNLEVLQDPETRELTDPDVQTLLEVALERGGNLRILVTSREPLALPRHLKTWERAVTLDDGLPVEDAIDLLRALDPGGRAGLQDAPAEQLAIIAQKTRGFPRALEVVAGLLLDIELYSLDDLLHDERLLANEIAPVIIQEAISRLNPKLLAVMEALALFGRPETQVALEFLLAPYIETDKLHRMLNRLVQARFVSYNQAAKTFTLHPIDQDYAYGCIPGGSPDDRPQTGVIPPFTRYALHYRAADFYVHQRKPRDDWKSIDDLAPQLAEFEHRSQAGDYNAAVKLLLEFDTTHLLMWGHYNRTIAMHEHLRGKITDSRLARSSIGNLGYTYKYVGRVTEAIQCFEDALESARSDADRRHEGIALHNLGIAYGFYLGQIERSLELFEQALGIYREVNYPRAVALTLGSLGEAFTALGQTQHAIALYEEAILICREIHSPDSTAKLLDNIGEALSMRSDFAQAIETLQEASSLAVQYHDPQVANASNVHLATVYLLCGDLNQAQRSLQSARSFNIPDNNHTLSVLDGLILSRLRDCVSAQRAFADAIRYASDLLNKTPGIYQALYTCGLAHAGLAFNGNVDPTNAINAYHAARSACAASGVIAANLRLLDALMDCPGGDILQPVRAALLGEDM